MRQTHESLQIEKVKQVVGGLGKPLGKTPAPLCASWIVPCPEIQGIYRLGALSLPHRHLKVSFIGQRLQGRGGRFGTLLQL